MQYTAWIRASLPGEKTSLAHTVEQCRCMHVKGQREDTKECMYKEAEHGKRIIKTANKMSEIE